MSGAQPKAGNIAGCVTVCAEVNPKITHIRHSQGWINEVIENLDELTSRVKKALENKETVSIAYLGNVVDVWEKFDQENLHIDPTNFQSKRTTFVVRFFCTVQKKRISLKSLLSLGKANDHCYAGVRLVTPFLQKKSL